MSMRPAPVILFVYRRVEHTKKAVEALLRNELAAETTLYIFADGYKNKEDKEQVLAVREYIHEIEGFYKIVIEESEYNRGLAESVIEGVTSVIENWEKAIIVEDDLVVSPFFLKYMNEALEKYKNYKNVYGITGYVVDIIGADRLPDSFFLPITSSWTWATWKRCWDVFDKDATGYQELINSRIKRWKFDYFGSLWNSQTLLKQMSGEIDSWWIRWAWAVYKNEGVYLTPKRILCKNEGFDGTGVHCGKDTKRESRELKGGPITFFPEIERVKYSINCRVILCLHLRKWKYKCRKIWHYVTHPEKIIIKLKNKKRRGSSVR